jgi:hypothetical protein
VNGYSFYFSCAFCFCIEQNIDDFEKNNNTVINIIQQALGNVYFIHKSIKNVKLWNFLTHTWETADGKNINTGNIESIATKEKAKFPQHFFPEVSLSQCQCRYQSFLYVHFAV